MEKQLGKIVDHKKQTSYSLYYKDYCLKINNLVSITIVAFFILEGFYDYGLKTCAKYERRPEEHIVSQLSNNQR